MSTDPGRVLAIIPFYKRRDQLDKCLAALKASDYPAETFIHDNSTNNLYFTRASNLGLIKAMREGYRFALLLNQDCYVRPDMIRNLINFMYTHPRCAIAAPRQVWSQDENKILHAGCRLAYPEGQHITGRKEKGDGATSARMPWVNGATMLARPDAYSTFGILDSNLQMIASDSDWCYTARTRGWEVWYCAGAECVHDEGVSATSADSQLVEIFRNDLSYFRDKWIGPNLYARLIEQPP
jgi:N-acetylglucosaminyl-diphospho-decaprenol L-rhamnosyltransferase